MARRLAPGFDEFPAPWSPAWSAAIAAAAHASDPEPLLRPVLADIGFDGLTCIVLAPAGPGVHRACYLWSTAPAEWAARHVEAQAGSAESTLAFYRAALAVRRTFATTAGDDVELIDLGPDLLAFRRGHLTVVLNCGTVPVALPEGQVLMASGPVAGTLPADTAVWLG